MWKILSKPTDKSDFPNYKIDGEEIIELCKNELGITTFEQYNKYENKDDFHREMLQYYVDISLNATCYLFEKIYDLLFKYSEENVIVYRKPNDEQKKAIEESLQEYYKFDVIGENSLIQNHEQVPTVFENEIDFAGRVLEHIEKGKKFTETKVEFLDKSDKDLLKDISSKIYLPDKGTGPVIKNEPLFSLEKFLNEEDEKTKVENLNVLASQVGNYYQEQEPIFKALSVFQQYFIEITQDPSKKENAESDQ